MWQRFAQRAARAAYNSYARAAPSARQAPKHWTGSFGASAAASGGGTFRTCRPEMQSGFGLGRMPTFSFASSPVQNVPDSASARPQISQVSSSSASSSVDVGDEDSGMSSTTSAKGLCPSDEDEPGTSCYRARGIGSTPGAGNHMEPKQATGWQLSTNQLPPHMQQTDSFMISFDSHTGGAAPMQTRFSTWHSHAWGLHGPQQQQQHVRHMATYNDDVGHGYRPRGTGAQQWGGAPSRPPGPGGAPMGRDSFGRGGGWGQQQEAGERRGEFGRSTEADGKGGRFPRGERGGEGRGQGRGEGRGEQRDKGGSAFIDDDVLELRVFTKDAFLQKNLSIPPGVREVMYAHRWDKLLVDVRRAVHLVADKGKVDEYTAMVAVGNMKGLLGLGIGDAPTAQEAVAAAHLRAYSNLTVVPLYRGQTIYHHIEHDYHFLKMIMQPRHSGAGIVASDLLTELCNLAGIRDINIKVHARRRSRMFVAMAFHEALQKQAVPHDGVEGSGVYLREIYHKARLPMGMTFKQRRDAPAAAASETAVSAAAAA